MEEKITINKNPSWGLDRDHVEIFAYWENAFTAEECDHIIAHSKKFQPAKAAIVHENKLALDTEYRDSNIAFISCDGIEWVYDRLTHCVKRMNENFFKFDLWGFAENLQFTQYVAPSGKYEAHIDKFYGHQIRKLSVVLQLSDPSDYDGCDLELLNSGERMPEKMKRDKGCLIVFPSYTLHRVTPITRGVRNSLVAWVTGKPFT